ncbi:pyruvate dehydrogenase complex dihydrolipoyllysine-residue acetyltransferase [Allofrancisella guangzhouensis]|uniref:Acetyltransferase component of pyruvate dehydrogenase complex n=1 Tax=Allofrancisella guangzhouensis TaxID=594679 RepID=A0A0A8E543_9GAMM|nr:pyruvate dehydrogenase complex dihydrolipoyllysine-residue acetyltransferase [Allofrancisella guangzhouensis]AJC48722.1 pyruvate dehydrogenase [Allofrancisella guangzhouensis]MBK2027399.1 pyruvate dehydrogenase complex dihydrolipoyllysine-residue acetyltransferase [Allofrancisella guangzhouensis]MBK2044277.1 pyruvate dehydrogenase complex dihydrolipoyllysine-residue acetyltransferase [Allofrancisella guangzhouensis]MBK2045185.1 pyruvate dehydrogenase complex dihydrolipoyllysine-residue acety
MSIEVIKVPDIGDYSEVDVIEVNVSEGDVIAKEDSLITLETDKASMEVPSPVAGKIVKLTVKAGDKVSQGSAIMEVEVAGDEKAQDSKQQQESIQSASDEVSKPQSRASQASSEVIDVKVPDIGDYSEVDVIEVSVKVGDKIEKEDSLITLETDKASMEVPSSVAGEVVEVLTKVGEKVSQGSLILKVKTEGSAPAQASSQPAAAKQEAPKQQAATAPALSSVNEYAVDNSSAHASPAVRKLARILNVDLSKVKATGRKGRVTKEDCYNYIKNAVSQVQSGKVAASGSGLDLLDDPVVDFAKFGEIETLALSRINKISSKNLHRNWVKIPHVTFYDDADVTDLEEFRNAKKAFAEKKGVKITPLSFLVKAAAVALQEFPRFNSSLSNDGESLIVKKYYNIGFAADTPVGLMVPVIKDADKKGIIEISKDIMELAGKARDGKLGAKDMAGATFTISSIGVLGTTAFTPIINMPEVAIMGVSKTAVKPVWNGKEFTPRTMLPLSLSTDHRVIDGALAAKFLTRYCQILSDLREIIM